MLRELTAGVTTSRVGADESFDPVSSDAVSPVAGGSKTRARHAQVFPTGIKQGDLGKLDRVGATPTPKAGVVICRVEVELVDRELRGQRDLDTVVVFHKVWLKLTEQPSSHVLP